MAGCRHAGAWLAGPMFPWNPAADAGERCESRARLAGRAGRSIERLDTKSATRRVEQSVPREREAKRERVDAGRKEEAEVRLVEVAALHFQALEGHRRSVDEQCCGKIAAHLRLNSV